MLIMVRSTHDESYRTKDNCQKHSKQAPYFRSIVRCAILLIIYNNKKLLDDGRRVRGRNSPPIPREQF